MARVGKRLKQAHEKIDREKQYELAEAAQILDSIPHAKFDETVDVAVKLGVDPRKAEENIRGVVSLPNGTGKSVRVAVFCKGEKIKEAEDAGADAVGAEDLVEKVKGGWLDFDKAVATPDMMAEVGKIGKVLGPRGLMPNPKVGTVTFDVAKAVEALKGGQLEYRVEKTGIIHAGVGKISFGAEKVAENVNSLLEALHRAKPKASKGIYFEKIFLTSTMGPSLQLDPTPYRKM